MHGNLLVLYSFHQLLVKEQRMQGKKKKNRIELTKAYNNLQFLNSPAARTIRILTEMIEPSERIRRHKVWNTIVFFGSARALPGAESRRRFKELNEKWNKAQPRPGRALKRAWERAQQDVKLSKYYTQAEKLSFLLTTWFKTSKMKELNFHIGSGGGPGIMEAANRGSRRARGRSLGLNISLPMEQIPNPYQDPEVSFEFHYFFIRKFWFFYL
jgi:hypothetical protein